MSQKIVKNIEKFTGSSNQDVTDWTTRVKLLLELNQIKDAEAALVLPLILDGDAFSSYMEMNPELRKSADAVFNSLTTAFACNEYEAYRKFISLRLAPEQSPDAFLNEIRRWARLARIQDESTIRKCFIVGLPSEVSTAVQSAAEAGKLSIQQILAETKIRIGAAHRIALTTRSESKSTNDGEYCGKCGRIGHSSSTCRSEIQRPRKQITCWSCGKNGHTAQHCRSKPQGNDSGDVGAPTASPKH